jgi:hypothetical protein
MPNRARKRSLVRDDSLENMTHHSRGAISPGWCIVVGPLEELRAQAMPGVQPHPQAL